eukprot:CAMPEP_0169333504 /NCGR_PEP_ID=MMETSP1017-20121227/15295_1 /TAXON_ID=342587 /ORGANISM="Karlodinium micrum, Strain CCMP2283" /LENGTH=75 /DNA_ID=CAMNT_0009428731 /DNA_START=845 /DNA_END=1072 /DNA_ORIENTATION=+
MAWSSEASFSCLALSTQVLEERESAESPLTPLPTTCLSLTLCCSATMVSWSSPESLAELPGGSAEDDRDGVRSLF